MTTAHIVCVHACVCMCMLHVCVCVCVCVLTFLLGPLDAAWSLDLDSIIMFRLPTKLLLFKLELANYMSETDV